MATNRTLLATIRGLHQESRQTYGSPRIWRALRKQGQRVGEHRVARLMRHDSLRAKTVKKWRATTHSSHHLPVAANTLQRQFTVSQPNRVWAGDITYVWTLEGWLYLAMLLDLYSRAVIGWAMGPRLTGELTEQALRMALGTNENTNGLLRQYFLKGTDLSRWSDQEIQAVAHTLNTRPRKALGWQTPAEALNKNLQVAGQSSVASTS